MRGAYLLMRRCIQYSFLGNNEVIFVSVREVSKMKKAQDGDMYEWVTKKRNYIGGQCPHRCSYCYVGGFKKRFPHTRIRYSGEVYLLEKELAKSEGIGHVVFVQDCGDLFADAVPGTWIGKVLQHLNDYPDNKYLLQTKNPGRFKEFEKQFPPKSIIGTTIETNRSLHAFSAAPHPVKRANALAETIWPEKMVSIEPIMAFDFEEFVTMVKQVSPRFVSIGADSKNQCLPEPSPAKVEALINELAGFAEVRMKRNLERLRGNG